MNVNSDAVIKDTVDTNMDKRVGEEDFMKNKYFDETAMNVNSDSVIKDTVDTNMDKRVGEEDLMKLCRFCKSMLTSRCSRMAVLLIFLKMLVSVIYVVVV